MGRPHGVHGAFFVEEASEDPARFAVGATLHGPGGPVTVVERKHGSGGRVVLRVDPPLERGAPLRVLRSELEQPAEDEYYVFELVGLEVVEESGRRLGMVAEVYSSPANDVLELDSGLALPLVAACVRAVERQRGRIVVASGFADPE